MYMDTTPRLEYPELPPTFYLGSRPFETPILIVTFPEGAYQAC